MDSWRSQIDTVRARVVRAGREGVRAGANGVRERLLPQEEAGPPRPITILGLDFVGLVFALFFFAWSLSPSLLPRDWVFQGIVSGFTSVTGYGVGVLLAFPMRRWVAPRIAWRRFERRVELVLEIVVALLAVFTVISTLLVAANWQDDVDGLMGMSPSAEIAYLRTGLIIVAIFLLVLLAARGLRRTAHAIARVLSARLHISLPLAHVIAPITLALAVALFVGKVLLAGSSDAARAVFAGQNNGTEHGVVQPIQPERSGSPASAAPWDTLGLQGRTFVAGGIGAARLAALSGVPAREPIRVYAGLGSAVDTAARVRLILAELDRTGAWDRKVLVVTGTTGTGWVSPAAADSLELMYNGDSAIAAMQYSFLPSWISFLVDRSAAATAGAALIDGIHQRWAQLPEGHRPRLIVYGESLGSQSAESAFGSLADLRKSVDGALFVGPPNSNHLWNEIKDRRDPGTPEVLPTYAGGLIVRFAAGKQDLPAPQQNSALRDPWPEPRVLYLQHASDPVVWWNTDLLFTRPDWLTEAPGRDRTSAMSWYPIVTFWQVSADLVRAQSPPSGHGHNYGDLMPYAWAAVTAPPGWTEADSDRVAANLVALRVDS
ncbi:alpha/beta hydrolase [Nocardia sp. NPDC006630]|uniref:alpha/beta hydrolase n=1 Tax=Nocardia sp. NPDC006630 TaxID=3157181 RepID=UPI0033B91E96